ncbi:TIGR02266 family protein [Hyalangium rubrum]|uniref:TIGR02266 family protein n=1 Tax=Hyalangium rubrum TaxID=3103134 RepID=A0ABU5HA15_9BACT|nr:TIGR02266 family protein [Hyalangium sp. s54d21]MDY7229617.1 TIGR02266 family protein [Hyalangium sp. s54d21]
MNTDSADLPFTGGEAQPNRRAEERVPARFEVHFSQTEDAAKALRAYSLNISSGGLCLRTRRAYDVGAPVRLELHVNGELFKLQGVVAWVRDESEAVGVRFTKLTEDDRTRLQSLIDSLKR